jgi:hypothetical protein
MAFEDEIRAHSFAFEVGVKVVSLRMSLGIEGVSRRLYLIYERTRICFVVRSAMIYFTPCPLSNASLYNVIDRAITRTKRRSYVFCSKVFANIYVQGRGEGGNVHVKGAGKAGFF